MTQKLFKFWVVLLLISGGIASWYSGIACKELWDYLQLKGRAPIAVVKWEARELGSSHFGIAVEYLYEVRGVSYRGSGVFNRPQFPNHFAAENHIKAFKKKNLWVWFREDDPSLCSLEREFPQKYCLQALLTVGVFAYFYFARSLFSRDLS